jgi:Phage Mu protein F like protein
MIDWAPKRRAEYDYASSLTQLWFKLIKESYALGTQIIGSAEFFTRYAQQAATRMITGLYFGQARSWREAAAESGRSRLMYSALQKELKGPVGQRVRSLIRENAQLITTLPKSVAAQVAAMAAAHGAAGGRAKELLGEGPLARLVRSSAMRLARTEISKSNTALIEARSENLGIPLYEWSTVDDERVRRSHRKMENVLVFWDDPPSPEALVGEKSVGHYPPGGVWNCRCTPLPVVRLEHLKWPHRVYRANRIQYMTLSQVRQITHYKEIAA